jgi:hypothetical protein
MARKRLDEELFARLRASGLRKQTASTITQALGAGRDAGGRGEKAVRGLISDLRRLADELEDRVTGRTTKRKAAGQKAARTRATAARKRSASAKKAAATRKATTTKSKARTTKARAKAKAS